MALPEGLRFLELGWWLIHAVTVWLVFLWGYRKGRADERRNQRAQRPPVRRTHGAA